MIKLKDILLEDYGGDTYNIGMKQYTTSKPKLSQNETEKKKGIDGKPCWRGYKYAGTENGKDKCVPIKKESSLKNKKAIHNECEDEVGMSFEFDDHEVQMAQNLLADIVSSASQLMTKIGKNEINLPGWIQDHISQAQNYINQANVGYHKS